MNLEKILSASKRWGRDAVLLTTFASMTALPYGCSKKGTDPEPPSEEIIISEDTKIVDNSNGEIEFYSPSDSVSQGVIVFSNHPEYQVGDVLVGDTSLAQRGMAEKVSRISGDTVYTAPAALTDIFEKGKFSINLPFDAEHISNIETPKGVNLKRAQGNEIVFEADSLVLDADGDESTKDDQVILYGDLSIKGDINIDVDISSYKLNSAKAEYSLNISGNLEARCSNSVFNLDLSEKFSHIDLIAGMVTVGPVPIFVSIGADAYASFKGSVESSSASASCSVNFVGGIKYDGNGLTPFHNSPQLVTSYSNPELKKASGEIGVGGQLELFVYNCVGLTATAEPFFKVDANPQSDPWWRLTGGVNFLAGLELEVFNSTLWNEEIKVWGIEKMIAEANSPPPMNLSLEANPDSGSAPLSSELTARGNGIKQYEFDFGDGSSYTETPSSNDGIFDGKASHVYLNSGNFLARVIGTNSAGGKDTADAEVNATDSSSAAFRIFTTSYCSDFFVSPSKSFILFTGPGNWGTGIHKIDYDGNNHVMLDGTRSRVTDIISDEKILFLKKSKVDGTFDVCFGEISYNDFGYSWRATGFEETEAKFEPGNFRGVYDISKAFSNLEIVRHNYMDGSSSRLTNSQYEERNMKLSLQGIVFNYMTPGAPEIRIMDLDGNNNRLLAYGLMPSWGIGEIAFEKDGGIWKIKTDGTELSRLTEEGTFAENPVVSPNGQKIAYVSEGEIYVMNSDGTGKRNLTRNPAVDDIPAWSPDSEEIIFRSDRDGSQGIYRMMIF